MSHVADAVEPNADGRDRRWDDHRQARREQLISSAIALIDREGGDVGVAAIAAEAGIPRSVVYKLFRDRDDLDEQIRLQIVADITSTLVPLLVPSGTIREMVRRGAETYVGWIGDHPHLHRFLGTGSGTRPTHGWKAIRGGKESFAHRLEAQIEALLPHVLGGRTLPDGAAENLAYALVGLTDSVVNRWLATSRTSADEVSRFLADAACAVIQSTARLAGAELDVDQVVLG